MKFTLSEIEVINLVKAGLKATMGNAINVDDCVMDFVSKSKNDDCIAVEIPNLNLAMLLGMVTHDIPQAEHKARTSVQESDTKPEKGSTTTVVHTTEPEIPDDEAVPFNTDKAEPVAPKAEPKPEVRVAGQHKPSIGANIFDKPRKVGA